MRYVALPDISKLSRRFDLFDAKPGYDPDLLRWRIFPPLPVCGDDLVWGFRLLKAAQSEGLDELPVVEIDTRGRLLCALKLENRAGRYSWKERLSVFELYRELSGEEEPDSISLAVSGDRGFFPRMERYASLPGHLRKAVDGGRLDLGIAEKASALPEAACNLAFSHPGLSFSRVREFLVTLSEIRMRDSLQDEQVRALAEEALAAGDPIEAIREARYPQLSGLARRFDAIRERYTGRTGVSLEAPANFEGDGFTVSYSFSTKAEFQKKLRALEKLEEGCDRLAELL